jgi:hypothetical protein
VIKIIAVLCSLSSPASCHEQTVTTSDFANVSMQSCLMGAPQLAEWMKDHPARTSHGSARANQSEEEPMTLAEPRSSGQTQPEGCPTSNPALTGRV